MPGKLACPCRIYSYGALGAVTIVGITLMVSAYNDIDSDSQRDALAVPTPVLVAQADEDGFHQVNRAGSVDLRATYDLDNLLIPEDEIHTLLPRDAIPSLTDPRLEPIVTNTWLQPGDRVIDVTIDDESVAVPLKILNYHEIANMTVAGEPVAATYCPLCDSASVISRRVEHEGESHVLEFGVSGALYNSNVLMYDRTLMGLWSQLGLRCVSGPMSGVELRHLPMRVVTWMHYKLTHPSGMVLSYDTGHANQYEFEPYADYFERDGTIVPVRGIGAALATKKTLGLGVKQGNTTWFITIDAIGDEFILDTPAGPLRVSTNDAGIYVDEVPEDTTTVQTFYYSWSAFHPDTRVISSDEERTPEGDETDS
ncbi:MAG: DUF3179 domain-containing (seleno)protein [Phycisphaerales bacterium JB043]